MSRHHRASVILVSVLFALILISPINSNAEESGKCCQPPDEFELYLVGDSDKGELTPFETRLDEEKSALVTASIFGEVEVGAWNLKWGEAGDYSSGEWTFTIPYEIVDATGMSANASVLVKVGGSTYQSSSQLPGVFLSGSGELVVPVEVSSDSISKDENIEVTFWLRSVVFSSPGSESGIRFLWGSEEFDASLTVSFPLVEIQIREASVKGDLVFFPVRLTSGFGDSMWTQAFGGGLAVQGQEVSESPITNLIEGGAEVTFVWQMPSGFNGGSIRTDFFLSPQSSLRVEADKNHQITAGEDSGDNSWYPEEEPPRTGGSNLAIIVDCEYDGDSIERETTVRFDGAISQWTRWGLDNIGNKSLGSSSWWRNLNSYSDDVSSADKQNGRVDDTELLALRNHLQGSKTDLKSFLSNGLLIDPDAIFFVVDPVDFGPIDISIDFGGSRAFNSDVISIVISASHSVNQDSRQKLIEDFVRPGGYEFWNNVELDLEIRSGMLSGLGGVYSDTDDIAYSHRRWIVMEILQIQESDIDSEDEFRIEFSSENSLLFSPLVSAMVAVFALCLALGLGMALTKRKSRVPSMILVGVLGGLTLIIYCLGLPMQIVIGVVSSSVLLVFPASIISPPIESGERESGPLNVGRVKCPSCGVKNGIESSIRPLRIDCKGCGSTLRIE